ncbi:MAG: hypothetical protein HXX15_07185 [Rhodopseudomonas sp.]|uniref:hypothetical protein n=1 Tax=Rhodopseudomonas sp. TaxID=1078 RepID=UPI0018215FDF|nr:hypothetical protein [Rhodopseudomonas sp.]NVN85860.1 hypothetical protein [Rhodopseudomonas sp.]
MPDQSTVACSAVAEVFRDDLDAFELHERQLLAEERKERARQLMARFKMPGFDLAVDGPGRLRSDD